MQSVVDICGKRTNFNCVRGRRSLPSKLAHKSDVKHRIRSAQDVTQTLVVVCPIDNVTMIQCECVTAVIKLSIRN